MPYISDSYDVTVTQSGTYSLEADWNLPIRSSNPDAYLYDFPVLRYEILSFPPTFISQSVEQYPFYFQFAELKFWSGLDGNYLDKLDIQHSKGYYNNAKRFITLPFSESGDFAVRQISVKFNYNPTTLMLVFIGRSIFIE